MVSRKILLASTALPMLALLAGAPALGGEGRDAAPIVLAQGGPPGASGEAPGRGRGGAGEEGRGGAGAGGAGPRGASDEAPGRQRGGAGGPGASDEAPGRQRGGAGGPGASDEAPGRQRGGQGAGGAAEEAPRSRGGAQPGAATAPALPTTREPATREPATREPAAPRGGSARDAESPVSPTRPATPPAAAPARPETAPSPTRPEGSPTRPRGGAGDDGVPSGARPGAAAPGTTAPPVTAPPATAPGTPGRARGTDTDDTAPRPRRDRDVAPGTAAPGTVAPSPTAPTTTAPGTAAPPAGDTTAPRQRPDRPDRPRAGDAPATTAPGATAPGAGVPGTTAPGTTAPGTAAPTPTAPTTTAPGNAAPPAGDTTAPRQRPDRSDRPRAGDAPATTAPGAAAPGTAAPAPTAPGATAAPDAATPQPNVQTVPTTRGGQQPGVLVQPQPGLSPRGTFEGLPPQEIERRRTESERRIYGGERDVTIEQLRAGRRERVEEGGRRVIIEEPGDRIIIREGDRTIIRHDETQRLRRSYGDARVERRGEEEITIVRRPNGVEIVTVQDREGNLVRRVRREPGGREVVIIDNGPEIRGRPRTRVVEEVVDLPPPRVAIPRERYIVETERASPRQIEEVLESPPVERLERSYTLNEVRQSQTLRERMPRIDLNTVTFEFGSWRLPEGQIELLAGVADAIRRVIERNPAEVFLIEGHTDAVGSDEDNLTLSDRRAETVALLLTERFGVPAENLTTQGYGEQYLKVNTQEANRENRRVTVRRITPLLRNEAQRR